MRLKWSNLPANPGALDAYRHLALFQRVALLHALETRLCLCHPQLMRRVGIHPDIGLEALLHRGWWKVRSGGRHGGGCASLQVPQLCLLPLDAVLGFVGYAALFRSLVSLSNRDRQVTSEPEWEDKVGVEGCEALSSRVPFLRSTPALRDISTFRLDPGPVVSVLY